MLQDAAQHVGGRPAQVPLQGVHEVAADEVGERGGHWGRGVAGGGGDGVAVEELRVRGGRALQLTHCREVEFEEAIDVQPVHGAPVLQEKRD